jgi:hypothetical protein
MQRAERKEHGARGKKQGVGGRSIERGARSGEKKTGYGV